MRDGWTELALNQTLLQTTGGVWGAEVGSDEINVTVVRSTEFTKRGFLNYETGVFRSIKASQLKSRELQEGDILLEKSGGGPDQPVGRVVYVTGNIPEKTVCSNFIQLVRPNRQLIEPLFLFYLMWQWHSNNRTLEFQAQTTGIRNLRTPDYLTQLIQLPPMPEQKRIVDLISSVDSYIEALQQQMQSVKKTRNGILHELLSFGSDKWIGTTLGEVANWGSGGTPKADNSNYYGGDIPWCVIGDLTETKVFKTEKTITPDGLTNSSAKIVNPGSVLLAMYGASIGRTGIAAVPMATNQAIAFANPDKNLLTSEFLLLFLQTQKNRFVEAGQGAAQSNISQTIIKSWPILLPSLVEQKNIIEIVTSLDEVWNSTLSLIVKTQNLRSSILLELLNGNHEIPATYDTIIGAP